jgi:hypothetical protein
MAYQVKTAAKGNAPATGMSKTPPPDEVTNIRSPINTGLGYGLNGFPGASSVAPGKRVLSPLAANLESSVDDDGVKAKILSRQRGALDETGDDFQTRKIDDKGYALAHGMRSRSGKGGKIPGA